MGIRFQLCQIQPLQSRAKARSAALGVAGALALALSGATTPVLAQSSSGDQDPASVIISRDVTVAAGDTLRSIAERELGRRGLAASLAEFNEIDLDTTLLPGMVIRIPINVPDRAEFATVIFSKGIVTLNDDSVGVDGSVTLGDVIRTGEDGFVSLEFANGSVINIQPESAAILQQLTCLSGDDRCIIEIETTNGRISSDIDPGSDQAVDFRITTPYASAAVRGTLFDVIADSAELIVSVTEGGVDVGALGATVGLDEGFGSVTEEGQAPGEAVALLPAPAFRNVPARITSDDQVLWWALTDVENYKAHLSNDSEGAQTLTELDFDGNSLTGSDLDSVSPGDYFLAVRGIDESGIPGFSASTRLVIAGIDDAVVAPDVTVERRGNDTLVSVTQPDSDASGYEIQISSSDDFSDPLSVDVGPNGSALFRISSDVLFARARQLIDPTTVSAFGAVEQNR